MDIAIRGDIVPHHSPVTRSAVHIDELIRAESFMHFDSFNIPSYSTVACRLAFLIFNSSSSERELLASSIYVGNRLLRFLCTAPGSFTYGRYSETDRSLPIDHPWVV